MKTTLVLFLICISSLSYGQLPFVNDIDISQKDYVLNFDQINDIVVKKYSHLENKKINIDSLYQVFKSKVSKVESKETYFKCLLNYFSELRNSHTTIYLADYGLKASVRMIENRLFIEKVNENVFTNIGIKEKNEIIEIDGMPTIDWLESQRKFVSASTTAHDINNALWLVFNGKFKVTRHYSIKTVNGVKEVTVNIKNPVGYSLLFPRDEVKSFGESLNESSGYISIKSMTGNVVNEFKEAYTSLLDKPNLIIDLRDNTGGSSGLSEQIARFLLRNSQKACVSRKKIKPYSNSYKGNLYVLVGVKTASAAESFAIDLLESENVVLIGSRTAGDTGNGPSNFKTDYGISFRIPIRKPQVSIKNFPMEGIGIPPHHKVIQTVEDYKNGVDTVLEFTLNKLIGS